MDYVRELELPGPTNDIRYLCAHISATGIRVMAVMVKASGSLDLGFIIIRV